jgi:O-acetyl-ADP-ribose deacetylase (regulator of RNase III)
VEYQIPMLLRNCVGFESRHGYRTFELYEGDLTNPEANADLLIVSAFAGDYSPDPGTVLGALHTAWGLDLARESREIDVSQSLGFWLSGPILLGHFKRILCVEVRGTSLSVAEVFKNVFPALALLDAKGIELRRIAFPLLGAGDQGIVPSEVMALLIPAIRKALEYTSSIEQVLLVEKNPLHAATLSEALNALLGRPSVGLPKGHLITGLRREICERLDTLIAGKPPASTNLFRDMRRVLVQDDVRSFEIGMLARRLVELIVDNQLGPAALDDYLAARIRRLREKNVASWILSYMHTLRFFGNEAAHEKNAQGQRPPFVNEEDVAVCLFCMQRLLDFWSEYCA